MFIQLEILKKMMQLALVLLNGKVFIRIFIILI